MRLTFEPSSWPVSGVCLALQVTLVLGVWESATATLEAHRRILKTATRRMYGMASARVAAAVGQLPTHPQHQQHPLPPQRQAKPLPPSPLQVQHPSNTSTVTVAEEAKKKEEQQGRRLLLAPTQAEQEAVATEQPPGMSCETGWASGDQVAGMVTTTTTTTSAYPQEGALQQEEEEKEEEEQPQPPPLALGRTQKQQEEEKRKVAATFNAQYLLLAYLLGPRRAALRDRILTMMDEPSFK